MQARDNEGRAVHSARPFSRSAWRWLPGLGPLGQPRRGVGDCHVTRQSHSVADVDLHRRRQIQPSLRPVAFRKVSHRVRSASQLACILDAEHYIGVGLLAVRSVRNRPAQQFGQFQVRQLTPPISRRLPRYTLRECAGRSRRRTCWHGCAIGRAKPAGSHRLTTP